MIHVVGAQLVDKARNEEDLLWYTSTNPDTPLHVDLPLNTAVALPISLDAFHRDLCFVFFAEHDVNVSPVRPDDLLDAYNSSTIVGGGPYKVPVCKALWYIAGMYIECSCTLWLYGYEGLGQRSV